MRVTLAQLPVYDRDIGRNLGQLTQAVRQAAEERADIVLTPEGSLSGYVHDFNRAELNAALAELEAFARERSVGLALGTCKEEEDGLCYNELRFYSPDGRYLGCHTKTLLCGTGEPPQGEIRRFSVLPPRVFDFGGVTVGGLICNDLWANPGCTPVPDPHLTQILSRMGARVIFHAVNGGRDAGERSQGLVKRFHEVHVLMKSAADNVVVCTVDNAFPEHIGVSSIGGVAVGAVWEHRLPETGRQVKTFELAL